MSRDSRFLKSLILHARYPYTALIISVIWIAMAIIISSQGDTNFNWLIIGTTICTVIISVTGFRSPK